MRRSLRFVLALATIAVLAASRASASPIRTEDALGAELPLWSIAPFVGVLLAIALLPLVAAKWWEHNRNKALVGALFSIPIAIYLGANFGGAGSKLLIEKCEEYTSFVALLAALFVISGGIYVRGSLSGTPIANTVALGLGALLANVIGTTGASMLLIRPYLRANRARRRKAHLVVFFIFVVSNCGGLLTPLGDPPLFLGFMKGVPFLWTTGLWPEWLVVNGALLAIFNVWDQVVLNREESARRGSQLEAVQHHEKLGVDGLHNLVFLAGVVAIVVASGSGLGNRGESWPFGLQELGLAGLAIASFALTPKALRSRNRFGFGPIVEVAVLFAAIFVTMGPALAILNAWSQGRREIFGLAFSLATPAQFFWSTGALSSFLDNAPTYLAFSATAAGLERIPLEGRFLGEFLAHGAASQALLAAISCGAVFMGANTYIGNGPNFMVKAIAEENGVEMPSFFGYLRYAVAILIPLFAIVCFAFLV